MIEVKVSDGKLSIVSTVSDFCGSMGYCEFRIPLALKGIKPPSTEATVEGAKAHQRQEQFEKEHFEMIPVTDDELADLKKDVEFAFESINTRLTVPLSFHKFHKANMLIFGRADKIYRSQGTLIVEEFKFPLNPAKYLQTFEPYPDHKLQTLLYLNSLFTGENSLDSRTWFEIPHSQKAWIINIKDRKSGKIIKTFKGLQTIELEQYMKDNLQRFAQIAVGEVQPQHHHRQVKCTKCRVENCQYNLSLNS
jgi:hypothetical protein